MKKLLVLLILIMMLLVYSVPVFAMTYKTERLCKKALARAHGTYDPLTVEDVVEVFGEPDGYYERGCNIEWQIDNPKYNSKGLSGTDLVRLYYSFGYVESIMVYTDFFNSKGISVDGLSTEVCIYSVE